MDFLIHDAMHDGWSGMIVLCLIGMIVMIFDFWWTDGWKDWQTDNSDSIVTFVTDNKSV